MVTDFIRGEYLPHVCDMRAGTEPNLPYGQQLKVPDQEHVSIYAKSENVGMALNVVISNPNQRFTLVTHNSDLSATQRALPKNLHWFAQNRQWDHPRVFSIPIGLENEYWFPYKQNVMLSTPDQETRIIRSFAQFNFGTHIERRHICDQLSSKAVDIHQGTNGNIVQHKLFCHNLKKYAFCVCPRGNGIDTHRMWEALYMGCIPICKHYVAHQFDKPLPILFVEEWSDITEDLLVETYNTIDRSLFNSDLLQMSHWKKRINNEI